MSRRSVQNNARTPMAKSTPEIFINHGLRILIVMLFSCNERDVLLAIVRDV